MLVVVLAYFVVRLPVAEIDAPDDAVAFHQSDSSKDARVVGRAQRSAHRLVQLIDGPRMPRFALKDIAHGVGYGARSGHIEIITR